MSEVSKERKSSNTGLHKAKTGKNDEFYTQLTYIEKELSYYREHFRNKVVFCNCDDPEESHFWKYFSENFEFLWLKKLISTHYETKKPSYKLEIVADTNGDRRVNKFDMVKTSLMQNGDFRSQECIEILKSCDIVVTNPPFSLFREYIAQLFEYEKQFIIIGNYNAVTYKEVFPLIQADKMWLWATLDGRNVWFRIPDDYEKYQKIENGTKYAFVASTICFTNLDYKKRHEDIILYKKYNELDYPKYDNYDAINVDKVKDIPADYLGIIGVPITFLNKYNPDQFEIIWQAIGNTRKSAPKEILEQLNYKVNPEDRGGCALVNGKRSYARLLIKNKKPIL